MLNETRPLSNTSPALETVRTAQTLDDLRDELLPDSVEAPEEPQNRLAPPQQFVGGVVYWLRTRLARVVWSRRLNLPKFCANERKVTPTE